MHSFSDRTIRLPTQIVPHKAPGTPIPTNQSRAKSSNLSSNSSSGHQPDYLCSNKDCPALGDCSAPEDYASQSQACVSSRTVQLTTWIVRPPTETICLSGQQPGLSGHCMDANLDTIDPLSHIPFHHIYKHHGPKLELAKHIPRP